MSNIKHQITFISANPYHDILNNVPIPTGTPDKFIPMILNSITPTPTLKDLKRAYPRGNITQHEPVPKTW
jgi:hypothetical protein